MKKPFAYIFSCTLCAVGYFGIVGYSCYETFGWKVAVTVDLFCFICLYTLYYVSKPKKVQ